MSTPDSGPQSAAAGEPSGAAVALSLDCLGARCPTPIVQLARRIEEIEPGQLIEVLADDPAAGPDIAAWCRMRGHELVQTDPPRHLVRRLAPEPPAVPTSLSG
jgi:tRNA 2-thiouridine synthesizing protein A